jgi:hypothetical protein
VSDSGALGSGAPPAARGKSPRPDNATQFHVSRPSRRLPDLYCCRAFRCSPGWAAGGPGGCRSPFAPVRGLRDMLALARPCFRIVQNEMCTEDWPRHHTASSQQDQIAWSDDTGVTGPFRRDGSIPTLAELPAETTERHGQRTALKHGVEGKSSAEIWAERSVWPSLAVRKIHTVLRTDSSMAVLRLEE